MSAKTQSKQSHSDDLKDRLSRYRQINLTMTGRKTGRAISQTVWFTFDEGNLCLLPVHGSDTQWYKNVLQNPQIQVEARGAHAQLKAVPVIGRTEVKLVIEKFRAKYGAGDVKKYYSNFDVAVVAQME